ncbi:hypothetical protein F8S13_22435 [Chloroflexia bacterium SDU3-3]|nr:hypothetical protein F8S13_22435 [Chloroflexia bacterium SDU3-3]
MTAGTISLSILDYLIANQPFGLSSDLTLKDTRYLAVALDNGNDAAKGVVLDAGGQIRTIRIPTAHVVAKHIQGGAGEITYQTEGGTPFWIGETALRNEGRALPVGPTGQRLADPRQKQFLGAVLVELLLAAGYPPGAYHLALGFAIPNTEIVREGESSEKMVVSPETRDALKEHLRGASWNIERVDARGASQRWSLTIGQLVPQAQSIGTFVCWSKAPNGKNVTPYDAVTVLDIGGGDIHQSDIAIKPYRLSTARIADGTIDIARGLKTMLPRAALNDVTAQHALVTRRALIAGKMQDISAEVQECIALYGQDMIAQLLPVMQQTRRFVLFTGGGTILLNGLLSQRLKTAGKIAGQDYTIVTPEYAAYLNAIGALFGVLFAASGTRR